MGGADATEVELKALKNDEAEGNWTLKPAQENLTGSTCGPHPLVIATS